MSTKWQLKSSSVLASYHPLTGSSKNSHTNSSIRAVYGGRTRVLLKNVAEVERHDECRASPGSPTAGCGTKPPWELALAPPVCVGTAEQILRRCVSCCHETR